MASSNSASRSKSSAAASRISFCSSGSATSAASSRRSSIRTFRDCSTAARPTPACRTSSWSTSKAISIDRFCAEGGLSLRERLGIFVQVCAAVEYAHHHLVIHRDIKPGNILVTGDGTPKLLDFGIAKLLDPETGLERATYTTMRVMTPESASPEQLEGRPVTVAVDVYALGVLLYRLAAGRSPYGDTPLAGADLIRVVCEQVPDPPSAHAPVPPDVDMIVMKALRKEPERRYASVAQLSEDVRRFLDGRPVLASPDSFRYRAGKFVSRHRVGVSAAAALARRDRRGRRSDGLAGARREPRTSPGGARVERRAADRPVDAGRSARRRSRSCPGSTQAREILLRRGTEYLDALSAEATGDDTLRREVSQGYLQLSRVQGSLNAQTLGDRAAAIKSLEKAVALLEPIARRPGASADDRVRLATLFAVTAQIQPVPAKRQPLEQARAMLDTLSADEARGNLCARGTRNGVAGARRHPDRGPRLCRGRSVAAAFSRRGRGLRQADAAFDDGQLQSLARVPVPRRDDRNAQPPARGDRAVSEGARARRSPRGC